jgi:hypothetical protein
VRCVDTVPMPVGSAAAGGLNHEALVSAVHAGDVVPVLTLHRQHTGSGQRRRDTAECLNGPSPPFCRLRWTGAHASRYVRHPDPGSAEGPHSRHVSTRRRARQPLDAESGETTD